VPLDNAGLAKNTEPPLETTALLYDLPLDEVEAVARHMGFPRDAEGYFLDESTRPPLRLTADEVQGWYTSTDRKTQDALDEKFRSMGLDLPPHPPWPDKPAALPVAHEAPGGTRLPADRLAKKKREARAGGQAARPRSTRARPSGSAARCRPR
jgi:hypothetical protein